MLSLTQGENKSIVTLSNNIEDLANGNNSMLELLSSLFYKMRFPNNEEIKKELPLINYYEGLRNYSKFILGKIEEHNTKVAVDFRNSNITIEHIMPQKLNSSWTQELGERHDEIHKLYLHNIGNLILTEFNSEIGNKSFAEKKQKLNASSLNYRLCITNRDIWDEISIKEHQCNMVEWFLEAFPLPDSYQSRDNWNTRVIESNIFSPLDSDSEDIAGGNKPAEMYIENKKIKVKSWQDVFIKFVVYFYENQISEFNFIVDNQIELFNKEAIVKWGTLKSIIDDKIDLSTRYKTFDGKLWDKAGDMTDDVYFIHINISAATCMNRVSNIMNKLNLPEEFVKIALK